MKMQYFTSSNFMLLRDLTVYFGKFTKRWQGPFLIDGFGNDHDASYTLKTLDGNLVLNTYHDNHLHIFRPQKRYLRLNNKF